MHQVGQVDVIRVATDDLKQRLANLGNKTALLANPLESREVLEGAGARNLGQYQLGRVADDLPVPAFDDALLGHIRKMHTGALAPGGDLVGRLESTERKKK